MRRACRSTSVPHSVSTTPVRLFVIRSAPIMDSNRRICALTAGWVRSRRLAVLVKLPNSQIATNVRSRSVGMLVLPDELNSPSPASPLGCWLSCMSTHSPLDPAPPPRAFQSRLRGFCTIVAAATYRTLRPRAQTWVRHIYAPLRVKRPCTDMSRHQCGEFEVPIPSPPTATDRTAHCGSAHQPRECDGQAQRPVSQCR